jgi:hypothetical protein
MKRKSKYILLIVTVFAFGRMFSQSLITAKFTQVDSICEGTVGVIKLSMYSNNTEQKVSYFKLMFEYDATLMGIESVTTENVVFGNFSVFYPASGQCVITDTLTNPINFYVSDPEETALVFKIAFNGHKESIGTVRFVNNFCYFKTEEDEDIAAFYLNSPDVNIHQGFIEMTLAQTGKGCSYETKGQAEVTVLKGVSPHKYLWSDGIQNPFYPYQVGQLSEGEVSVIVTDGNGCRYNAAIIIETLRAPEINWKYTPEVIVKKNPVHFYVTDFGDGYNWEWKIYYTNPDTNIRDSLELGEKKNLTDFDYIFLIDNDYEVQLNAQSIETGCDTTVVKFINVEPQLFVTQDQNRELFLYPNPTQSEMTVSFSRSTVKIVQMEIYDVTSRKVHQQIVGQSYDILNLNKLAQGIYILKIRLEQGDTVIRKIVKQ